MKWIIVVIVVLVVVGGGAGLYFSQGGGQAGPTVNVRVEQVARGSITEIVAAPGDVQPITKVSISARTSARILALPYDEGDAVTKGDETAVPPVPASVLVSLDDSDLRAVLVATQARRNGQAAQIAVEEQRIKGQRSQLEAQRSELEDAGRELRRNLKLYESKDVSEQTVQQLQAKFDQVSSRYAGSQQALEADIARLGVMRYEVEAADAEIARAVDQLSYTKIVSPIDGIVTKVNAKAGELVMTGTMNNAGTVLMEVADLSKLQVNVRLDQSNVVLVKAGQRARVRLQAFEEEVFTGVVKSVGLDVETETRNSRSGNSEYYEAEILLDDPGRRLPVGLKADAEIEILTHEEILKVPSQAVLAATVDELPELLRTKPEVDVEKTVTPVVYVLENGKAVVRPVKIGASDLTHTLVVSGITEGDKVIVGPYKALLTLANDMAVTELVATTQPSATQPTNTQAATTHATSTQATTQASTTRPATVPAGGK